MKKKKTNIYYVLLFTLMVVDLNFLNLINTKTFNIFGIYYTDIVLLLNIFIFLFQIIKDRFFIINKIYTLYIFGLITIMITSSCAGQITYNQSLLNGLIAQREWISWMLLIYPISRWLKSKKITIDGIKKSIIVLCNIYACICILQYFLNDIITFTYTTVDNRYGSVRLYFDSIFFCLAIGIVIDNLINQKNINKIIIYCIELISYLFVIIFITKGRMQTLSLLFSIVICLLIRRNIKISQKIIISILIVILMCVFMSSTMGQDIIALLMGKSENDTLSVRDAGRIYYMDLYKQSWKKIIFGCGFPNVHNTYASKLLNPLWSEYGSARYYLEDVGLVSPLIKYGLIGVLLWGGFMAKSILLSYKIYKKSGEMVYLQFLIMDLIGCATLIPTMFNTTIVFPLIIAIIFFKSKELKI